MAGTFGGKPVGLVSDILNLEMVLTRKPALKVPRYQRAYTWGEREVRQLIQDLRRAFQRGATFYFIGQIVLVKNNGKLEISDGQQRLATLTMIIAYVRDRLPGRAKQCQSLIMDGDRPRLLLRDEDASFYRGFVQEPGKMSALAQEAEWGVDSKDLLCLAARTIESALRDLDDRALDAFMSYVARACTINVVDADERGCAQTVFNTLNKRGSPLSGADIIKSDLIENAGLTDAEANEAARKWEEIEDMFQRENFAYLLEWMPFLLTGEFLLSPGDLATFRGAVERAGGVRTFLLERMPKYAEALRAILTDSIDVGAASREVNRRVKLMKEVKVWDWAPAAIAFLSAHSSETERARRFFQALDLYCFACELGVIDTRVRDDRYARAACHVDDDRLLHGPKGALALTEAERRGVFEALNRSRKRDPLRRLLLLRVEGALREGSFVSMNGDVTAEHILPKGGSPWWNERFPDPKMRKELTHLLGNFTLVTHDQNKRAENKSYPEKRRIFFDTPGAPIYALTRDIVGIEEWSQEAIESRTERLVAHLCNDWGMHDGAGARAA